MNRKQQWLLWFNSLPIEERAEMMGIEMPEGDCVFDIQAVDMCEDDISEQEVIRMARIQNGDSDLPII